MRNNIRGLRARLGITQRAFAEGIGCTQGNIANYERGQTLPPGVARRVIEFAATRRMVIGFDDLYSASSELARPPSSVALNTKEVA